MAAGPCYNKNSSKLSYRGKVVSNHFLSPFLEPRRPPGLAFSMARFLMKPSEPVNGWADGGKAEVIELIDWLMDSGNFPQRSSFVTDRTQLHKIFSGSRVIYSL